MQENPDLNKPKLLVFPGAISKSDRATEEVINFDSIIEADKNIVSEQRRGQFLDSLEDLTQPYFLALKGVAKDMDSKRRLLVFPGQQPGRFIVSWEDKSLYKFYTETWQKIVSSRLLFDKSTKGPILRSYTIRSNKEDWKIPHEIQQHSKLDMVFGSNNIKSISLSWCWYLDREDLIKNANSGIDLESTTFISFLQRHFPLVVESARLGINLLSQPNLVLLLERKNASSKFIYQAETNEFTRTLTKRQLRVIKDETRNDKVSAEDFLSIVHSVLLLTPSTNQ